MKAYKDGEVVAEFMGAQPGPQVERFLDALVPSEAEELVARRRRGVAAPGAGARARPRRRRRPARQALAARGERDGGAGAARRRRRLLRRRRARRPAAPRGATPELQDAFAALDDGEVERGLDPLIGAIPATEDADRRDDLRRSVVGVLDELGVEHPVARESRRKLAAALY